MYRYMISGLMLISGSALVAMDSGGQSLLERVAMLKASLNAGGDKSSQSAVVAVPMSALPEVLEEMPHEEERDILMQAYRNAHNTSGSRVVFAQHIMERMQQSQMHPSMFQQSYFGFNAAPTRGGFVSNGRGGHTGRGRGARELQHYSMRGRYLGTTLPVPRGRGQQVPFSMRGAFKKLDAMKHGARQLRGDLQKFLGQCKEQDDKRGTLAILERVKYLGDIEAGAQLIEQATNKLQEVVAHRQLLEGNK